MTQPSLIPTVVSASSRSVVAGKRGRGATARRTSRDPGAPRFVLRGKNLTGDSEMTFAFRPLKTWSDNGDFGLPIAFHFFTHLGCFTVANDRIMAGIYRCLEHYTQRELCEAIDFKAASLGETYQDRQSKIGFVPQPENFFQPDGALLKKWIVKSPAWQKRQNDEARRRQMQKQSEPAAQAREHSRAAADFSRQQQHQQEAAAARKAQQERENALVQKILEQLSDVERKAFEALVQDEHSAAEFKRIAAPRWETILPADELARRVAARVRFKRIVSVDRHGNVGRVSNPSPVGRVSNPPSVERVSNPPVEAAR